MTSGVLTVRQAREADLQAITEIYNEAIRDTTATFDTELKTLEDRRQWFASHGEKHPVLVAELSGRVIGWGSLSPWSDRCAYDATAENSVYIHSSSRGQGAGRALMNALLEHARKAGLHVIIAKITAESEASIQLHESFGFEKVGTLREVGVKFGRVLDVELMQILL